MNLVNIFISVVCSVISGGIIAYVTHKFTLKRLNKSLEENRNNLKIQHKNNLQLEWYGYMLKQKLENIQQLQNLLIAEIRHTLLIKTIYIQYFEESLKNSEYSDEKWAEANEIINNLPQGDKLIEKDKNLFLNFFPNIKEFYERNKFVEQSLKLNGLCPYSIKKDVQITELNTELSKYKKCGKKFEDDSIKLLDLLEKEHFELVNSMDDPF